MQSRRGTGNRRLVPFVRSSTIGVTGGSLTDLKQQQVGQQPPLEETSRWLSRPRSAGRGPQLLLAQNQHVPQAAGQFELAARFPFGQQQSLQRQQSLSCGNSLAAKTGPSDTSSALSKHRAG